MKEIHFESIDSTNTYLKNHYNELDNLTIISADYQSEGKGRLNRTWESNTNENLMFSILIKDKDLIDKFDCLSLAAATSIFTSIQDLNIHNVSIKWPNDVYINGKKVCGILLEGLSNNDGIYVLIIGIGVNVNQLSFTDEIKGKTTSLALEADNRIDLKYFKEIVYQNLLNTLNEISNNNLSYLNIIRDNNYLKDMEVYAEINNKKELVKVIDINDDNSLKVSINDKIYNLTTGEITFHI